MPAAWFALLLSSLLPPFRPASFLRHLATRLPLPTRRHPADPPPPAAPVQPPTPAHPAPTPSHPSAAHRTAPTAPQNAPKLTLAGPGTPSGVPGPASVRSPKTHPIRPSPFPSPLPVPRQKPVSSPIALRETVETCPRRDPSVRFIRAPRLASPPSPQRTPKTSQKSALNYLKSFLEETLPAHEAATSPAVSPTSAPAARTVLRLLWRLYRPSTTASWQISPDLSWMNSKAENRPSANSLDRATLVRDLTRLGVPRGGLLMVHSSLRSLGHVAGGADAVLDALLETLGPDGTLVLPTFTYPIARDPGFVFDPLRTPSLMGAISDAGRRHPRARRSLHLQHSIAVIGPLAETIVTSGGESSWDTDSPMRQIRDRDGQYLLLGVPYQNLTAVHVCEIELQVPYRKPVRVEGTMRRPDGSTAPFASIGCPPQPGHPGSDFNRLGQRMEDAGLVRLNQVGNAVARLLGGHNLRRVARELYEQDDLAFLRQGGVVTRLAFGHTIETDRGEHCVVDPARMYGAT